MTSTRVVAVRMGKPKWMRDFFRNRTGMTWAALRDLINYEMEIEQ